jgi:hypothetical protein
MQKKKKFNNNMIIKQKPHLHSILQISFIMEQKKNQNTKIIISSIVWSIYKRQNIILLFIQAGIRKEVEFKKNFYIVLNLKKKLKQKIKNKLYFFQEEMNFQGKKK